MITSFSSTSKNIMICRELLKLLFLILIKNVFLILLITTHTIGLGPDEAQYWTWSQDLAPGYYSKPPGIAWLISLSTSIFGSTELGVRVASLFLGSLLPFAVFSLGRASGLQPRTSFWAGAIMALTPLGILASFLAITDVGMVLFWTLGSIEIAKALQQQRPLNPVWVGLNIGLGALFKWPIYYLWIVAVAAIFFIPKCQQKKILWLVGLMLSLLGLVPSIIWNAQHGWVTFKHVFMTLWVPHAGKNGGGGNLLPFFGEQIVLFSPILFVLFLVSLRFLFRNSSSMPVAIRFWGWSSLSFFAFFFVLSIFKKLQGNWCDFVYPLAIVFLSWVLLEKESRKMILQAGLTLSVFLCTLIFSIPFVQQENFLQTIKIPYKLNPFRHNVGWENLEKIALPEIGFDPNKHVLIGDKYQTCSILSFYNLEKKRAYFLNLHGIRKNQFSFWPPIPLGANGYYVALENSPDFSDETQQKMLSLLSGYFDKIEIKAKKTLFKANDLPVKSALFIYCEGYNGHLPEDPEIY